LLLDALADRAGDDVRATPIADLPGLLEQRGVSSSTAARVAAVLRAIDAARYAPGGAQQKLRDDVAALVDAIDDVADSKATS
jgi:hypothetical protein